MAGRPTRAATIVVGCAALAGIIGVTPVSAQQDLDDDPVIVEGSAPTWATSSARVGDVDDGQIRRVQVALALKDPRGAQALATAVSTPGDPRHGRFLSAAEFVDRFAPEQRTVDRVTDWLREQGLTVTGISTNRHFVDVEGSVGRLESAFRVTLSTFRHTTERGTVELAAPESPVSVPRSLRGAVQAVLGLDDSARTVAPKQIAWSPDAAHAVRRAAPGDPLSCARHWGEANNTSVPQRFPAGAQSNALCGYDTTQMRDIYGLTNANTGAGNTVAIVGAYHLDSIVADTNRAGASFGAPPLAPGQYSAVLPAGYDNHDQCAPDVWAAEQALDVQAVHTIAPAAKIIYYGASSCFTLFDALNKAVAENKASVISNSYGYFGESSVPVAIRRQMDSIALQAAIQGQAITVSSGDAGDNSGGSALGRIEADFPASHPWVTAVGGTSVALGGDNRVRFHTGWQVSGYTHTGDTWTPHTDADGRFAGGAGGGVSALYDQPAYQRGIVPDTVAQGKRTVPDIAALADVYTGIAVGWTTREAGYIEMPSGGTSAASPIIAGLVANTAQAQGVTRLGFLNSALYRLSGRPGITDVTPVQAGVWTPFMIAYGGVSVPDRQGSYLAAFDDKPQSLQSARGWDNTTGVGTPNAAFLTSLGK